ncbi:hypothetical protein SPRG_19073 [Saprolegnia parasitica CBS 223.65]|uniref:EF-hand domain-containing protein n=1 Tax=Saprolegnia parasitica (strain CBS 223.65) TaxID=695850 RepID=A0A067D6F0_SAPPC|nr:hypothetical protein SPRG_19073 [Saprolegnia parasitica CBS 223.65]KDO34236.1 hypothetical protein SPRG_19073 [Saprolegnia parasitica CBS 223.65]|eukprot:XP_012195269.1 hypothetical protein SPRG_19073 [Saprolegnia parasitica CBS 223.65]
MPANEVLRRSATISAQDSPARKPPVPKFKRNAKKLHVLTSDASSTTSTQLPAKSSQRLRPASPTRRSISERSFQQLQTKCFQLKPPPSPSLRSSPAKTVHYDRSPPPSSSLCESSHESDNGTRWATTHDDIRLLQSTLVPASASPYKPPPSFGCRECGSKDLTAFCWKGCRNFTSLEELSDVHRSVLSRNQHLEVLVASQESALSAMTMAKDEQAQLVALLQRELQRIHAHAMQHYAIESTPQRVDWAVAGVKALVHRFDLDGDELLNLDEMNALKMALGHTSLYTESSFAEVVARYSLDTRPCPSSGSETSVVAMGLTPEGLMQLYDVLGIDSLELDLQRVQIYIGRSKTLDSTAASLLSMVADLEGNLKAAMESRARLRAEHDEKARTIARLRDNLVAATAQAVQYREEVSVAHNSHQRVQDELQHLHSEHHAFVHANVVSKAEMVSSQDAVVEMRALLEAQISDTETWQRHCWELQEQLSSLMASCSAHKTDLWKLHDAKKAEERRSRLLYMQAHQGKKHDIPHRS